MRAVVRHPSEFRRPYEGGYGSLSHVSTLHVPVAIMSVFGRRDRRRLEVSGLVLLCVATGGLFSASLHPVADTSLWSLEGWYAPLLEPRHRCGAPYSLAVGAAMVRSRSVSGWKLDTGRQALRRCRAA